MKIAAIQINSGNDSNKNLARIKKLLTKAGEDKPDIIVLPEYSNYMGKLEHAFENAAEQEGGEWFIELSGFARSAGINILAGLLEKAGNGKSSSVVYLFGNSGSIERLYVKIHLFDADVPSGRNVRESEYLIPGSRPATASVGDIVSGFAICYDLRFPELFRYVTLHGAKIVYVPSAFTNETGRSHWETLLRARAIENQVFIVAPNQVGKNEGINPSYGHSMIIDPWGKILAEAPGIEGRQDAECVIQSVIDLDEQANIRKQIPCLHHIKVYHTV